MSDRGDNGGKEGADAPSLEERATHSGSKIGDRRVRIIRPAAGEFRRRGGHYVATPRVDAAQSRLGRVAEGARRILFGARLTSEEEAGERLSKKTGLAILASDNISSSAYATEEAMRVLAIAGSAALALTMPIAIAVCVVLAVVILSESRVIRAYPNGGGSYIVAKDNHGVIPGLIAASALLIDYVLTVAVSSAAGVAAISSFVPAVHDHRVLWSLALIALLTVGNLRGIREAGVIFAAPTYVYVLSLLGLIGYGLFRIVSGDVPVAVIPRDAFEPTGLEMLTPLIVLRAFASGSVGLTGSEAIANGVPNFKPPESRNAVITLVSMGTIFGTLFLGLTYLATHIGIVPDQSELETVNSMLTRSLVGDGTPFYYLVQLSTAIILLLAANTGFSGFPRLASVLADDRFMPRQFAFRGERLAFSFGIIALALMSAAVLAAFHGSVTELVPLYTIGVFAAFTLSQSGLVRRWWRLRNPGWRLSVFINSFGWRVDGASRDADPGRTALRDQSSLPDGARCAPAGAPGRAHPGVEAARCADTCRATRPRHIAGRGVRAIDLADRARGAHRVDGGERRGVRAPLAAVDDGGAAGRHRVALPLAAAAAAPVHRAHRRARRSSDHRRAR